MPTISSYAGSLSGSGGSSGSGRGASSDCNSSLVGMVGCFRYPWLHSLRRLNLCRKRTEPLIEWSIGIDDDFQLPVLQSSHEARTFGGEWNLHPFAVEPE